MAQLRFDAVTSLDAIDLDRYPIVDLEDHVTGALVREQQSALARTGVCIMPGFVRPQVVSALIEESDRLAPLAHLSDVPGTPYLEIPSPDWPDGHPRLTIVHTRLRAVAYDLFPADSILRTLYEADELMAFVAAILGRSPLYRYADPLGALNLAVMEEGDELGWHYDQTDFVVSLAIQPSRAGGEFVSARRIRQPDDERYDEVATVLKGEPHESIEIVPMTPGTLMLFEGRWSMHCVTPIVGDVPRYVGLLAYDTKPGTQSSALLKQVRYGRAA
jgi:hypothetical protein